MHRDTDIRHHEIGKGAAYPTSSRKKHNWDALEQDIKREEEEEPLGGEAELQRVRCDATLALGGSHMI